MRAMPLSGIRLLVVEDDALISLDIESTLEHAGAIIVGSAHSGASAHVHKQYWHRCRRA